ncbi:MAG: hypothetical protein GY868_12835 [Deltaproteobacteria bacterium]|nr:hypothetical protein [Deltaproteobacteria bacterium]
MTKFAQDNFEQYFAEKLWEMIPAIYRREDGIAENPGVLRALVEIMAGQAAILRRSHDRLWEDQFIELCQDWAAPYFGDLVASRLVSALNKRGRRVDVAKTIYYRRRKGTLRVLEELIGDIAGWEGKVVEEFRRLARMRHGLDPKPASMTGRFSGPMPGGWADLRRQRGAELTDGPFAEFYHTADVRQHTGLNGRHNIPKLAFHLYRLRAFCVMEATPFPLGDGLRFACDPSGRNIPLFMPRRRPENLDDWRSAKEWELPAPIPCRLLGHGEYVITEALAQNLENNFALTPAVTDKLRTLNGFHFPSEARLKQMLELLNEPSLISPAVYREILSKSLIADCGKAALLPEAISVEESPGVPLAPEDIGSGALSQWPVADPGKRLLIDPERGRLQFFNLPPAAGSTLTYHYGFAGEIGAGTYSRPGVEQRQPTALPNINAQNSGGTILADRIENNGITQIDGSATYQGIGNKLKVLNLTLQAANQQRPYIRLNNGNWFLQAQADEDAKLCIEGLWLGSDDGYAVILRGDYEEVTIRHTTFDPGGDNDVNGNPISSTPLIIEAHVETLIIESSIMGRILTQNGGVVENLKVLDSIIDETDSGQTALDLARGEADLKRTTVFGKVDVNRLWASEALITGLVDVTDTQEGCFRFSAAPEASRLPRQSESHILDDAVHIFSSRNFGQPGYGQLSKTAPPELYRGAENGSEIGAFSSLINPIKSDGLKAKVDEYMPFGLIPIFIQET